jgi:hypothetical protein
MRFTMSMHLAKRRHKVMVASLLAALTVALALTAAAATPAPSATGHIDYGKHAPNAS